MRRRTIALILLISILSLAGFARAEEAKNLNQQGVWTFAGGKCVSRGDFINDNNSESRRALQMGKTLRIRFSGNEKPAFLGVEWFSKPTGAVIERYDAQRQLLGSDTVNELYVSITALEEGTKEIVIRASKATLVIAEVDVFGAGTLPEPYHPFLPLPEKLDYMVIVAHPDDDVLFLGAVVPYLGAEEGLIGTIVYMTNPTLHQRHAEALNGAWTMGLRYQPIFWNMHDVYVNSMAQLSKYVSREDTVRYLVRLIRKYRPVVLFTHEPEGEYGHMQHRFVSATLREAVIMAQDAEYDAWSQEQHGTWQVQKLYLHDYEQAEVYCLFDPDEPLRAFDGKTAYEICRAAYKKHVSQKSRAYAVNRYGDHPNSFNFFGLAYAAGEEKGQVRDGIDPAMFSDYVPPTPSPAPTSTPVPTPSPSPTPSPTPTPSPVPSPSPSPTAAPATFFGMSGEDMFLDPPSIAAIAGLLLLGGLGARLWLKKWREL